MCCSMCPKFAFENRKMKSNIYLNIYNISFFNFIFSLNQGKLSYYYYYYYYLLTGNSYRKNNSSICTYDLKFPLVHTDLV